MKAFVYLWYPTKDETKVLMVFADHHTHASYKVADVTGLKVEKQTCARLYRPLTKTEINTGTGFAATARLIEEFEVNGTQVLEMSQRPMRQVYVAEQDNPESAAIWEPQSEGC